MYKKISEKNILEKIETTNVRNNYKKEKWKNFQKKKFFPKILGEKFSLGRKHFEIFQKSEKNFEKKFWLFEWKKKFLRKKFWDFGEKKKFWEKNFDFLGVQKKFWKGGFSQMSNFFSE